MELARGIEPSNRRRVGPEACLAGSCGEEMRWPIKFFATDQAVRGARQIAVLITPQFRFEMQTGDGRKTHFPLQFGV